VRTQVAKLVVWTLVAGALVLNNPNLPRRGPLGVRVATSLAEAAGLNPALRTAGELGAPSTIFNPYLLVAIYTGAATLTQNVFTKIPLTLRVDKANAWDAANNQFIVPRDAWYSIDFISNAVMPAAAGIQLFFASTFTNAAEDWRGHGERFFQPATPLANQGLSSLRSLTWHYRQGDKIDLRGYTDQAGATFTGESDLFITLVADGF
jgi:hypothetical protein